MRQRNILRKLIQFSLKQCGFFQISLTWILERGLHPIQLRLLLKGFQVSKNWQCTGKILGLFFLVCFVLKWKEISETIPFCTFGSKQCVCLNYLVRKFSKKLAFKSNKNQNFKILYLKCLAEFRGQTNIVMKFIQFSLKRRDFFQSPLTWIHDRGLHHYYTRSCSKASKSQRTGNAVVKFWVFFFLSVSF